MNNHGKSFKRFLRHLIYYLPLNDRQFTELMYRHYFKQPLNLNPPVTFNEKIQWLKLSDSSAAYAPLVDKYEVRQYVAAKVGSQYLNELYGVYSHESEIDFACLPQSFVLKATHGSGWNIFCRDKGQFDLAAARKQLRNWRKINFYRLNREPNYKNIRPRIICERLLEEQPEQALLDYKFFCFHGQAQLVQVDFDRFTQHTRNLYDRNWQLCPFTFIYPNNPRHLSQPVNFATMLDIAETLAGTIPFVRVDLYNVKSQVVFGELSFTPESGFGVFDPAEWDHRLGKYLHLPVGE